MQSTVQLNAGNKVFYRTEGSGEPLILIHSLGVSSEAWRFVMPALAEKFTIYAVDIAGHGKSDKPDRNYLISDYASDIIEFMEKLKIKKAAVIGNSIGSTIGAHMAAYHPERVRKLVLVGCPATGGIWDRLERLAFSASKLDMQGAGRPLTLEELSVSYVHTSMELLEWVNSQRALAGSWMEKGLIAVALWDVQPLLPLIQCPTLVLYGRRDVLKSEEGILLRGIKDARRAVIPNAGHLPQIDEPEAFVKAILEFL